MRFYFWDSEKATGMAEAPGGGGGGGGGGGAGLGKGAWDCDTGKAIPPEAEAAVFEEVSLN